MWGSRNRKLVGSCVGSDVDFTCSMTSYGLDMRKTGMMFRVNHLSEDDTSELHERNTQFSLFNTCTVWNAESGTRSDVRPRPSALIARLTCEV
jgi:hypothetical protein